MAPPSPNHGRMTSLRMESVHTTWGHTYSIHGLFGIFRLQSSRQTQSKDRTQRNKNTQTIRWIIFFVFGLPTLPSIVRLHSTPSMFGFTALGGRSKAISISFIARWDAFALRPVWSRKRFRPVGTGTSWLRNGAKQLAKLASVLVVGTCEAGRSEGSGLFIRFPAWKLKRRFQELILVLFMGSLEGSEGSEITYL